MLRERGASAPDGKQGYHHAHDHVVASSADVRRVAAHPGEAIAYFRLGYGGGFFDRTLAGFDATPLVIGVGYADALIPTIFPQPHDIPMDWIITGTAPPLRRTV
jgi:hypothetical protein